MNTSIARILLISAALMGAGCASVAVSNDAIEKRTATALGLANNTFTISDRVDDGVRTDYTVKTSNGKQYACYVTGTVSVTGRVVSDAICIEKAKANTKPASTTPASSSCNALLKAAKKC